MLNLCSRHNLQTKKNKKQFKYDEKKIIKMIEIKKIRKMIDQTRKKICKMINQRKNP